MKASLGQRAAPLPSRKVCLLVLSQSPQRRLPGRVTALPGVFRRLGGPLGRASSSGRGRLHGICT